MRGCANARWYVLCARVAVLVLQIYFVLLLEMSSQRSRTREASFTHSAEMLALLQVRLLMVLERLSVNKYALSR